MTWLNEHLLLVSAVIVTGAAFYRLWQWNRLLCQRRDAVIETHRRLVFREDNLAVREAELDGREREIGLALQVMATEPCPWKTGTLVAIDKTIRSVGRN